MKKKIVIQKQCQEVNIKFYDTSFERDSVLEEVMRYLINFNEEI